MSAIRKSLLQLLFSGFTMRRWNDKLRPIELFEIDKQAHKMIVAFLLTHINSRSLCASDRIKLQQEVVEGGIFDYLYRLVITDIKPPVFYKIRENSQHYAELTDWVLEQLEPVVRPLDSGTGGFWERFIRYHRRTKTHELSDQILKAAHLYASEWEFSIIRPFNTFDEEIEHIAHDFTQQLDAIHGVQGLDEIRRGSASALGRLAAICGQLRFQIRWSGTPRVPETSVLGHEFLVGLYAYCFSIAVGACRARSLNNFHAGLFHDLPELLTRDIISPVKSSVRELPALIKQYELQEMERRILTPLRDANYGDLEERLRFFLGLTGKGVESEFNDVMHLKNGTLTRMDGFDDLQSHGNNDEDDAKDGKMLKSCDNLAAFMEADTSIRRGVASANLYDAVFRLKAQFREDIFGPISMGTLLADFD